MSRIATHYPYLTLMRPANIITAVSDIWAGAIIAIAVNKEACCIVTWDFLLLTLSTIGLYGGGVVFNDYFDADIDALERPERPIPSGRIVKKHVALFGGLLLVAGIVSALFVSIWSGLLAVSISVLALVYDKYAKHHMVFGPIIMGLCRSGNLLLGLSLVPQSIIQYGFMGVIPLIFIGAVTLTSRGEVHGNNRFFISIAIFMDIIVAGILFLMADYYNVINIRDLFPFLLVWIIINLGAKLNAIIQNRPKNIMYAVKIGVISLILLNASYVAGFGGWATGLLLLALIPVSLILAKQFAVT